MTIGQGTETSRRPRWLKTGLFALALCLSGVAAAAVFHALGQPLTGIDDANIFLTYARNLARGDGVVPPSSWHVVKTPTSTKRVGSLSPCLTEEPWRGHSLSMLMATTVSLPGVTVICRSTFLPS